MPHVQKSLSPGRVEEDGSPATELWTRMLWGASSTGTRLLMRRGISDTAAPVGWPGVSAAKPQKPGLLKLGASGAGTLLHVQYWLRCFSAVLLISDSATCLTERLRLGKTSPCYHRYRYSGAL